MEPINLPYSLTNQNSFKIGHIKSTKYGTETVRCRTPKIWKSVPSDIKSSSFLNEFKLRN